MKNISCSSCSTCACDVALEEEEDESFFEKHFWYFIIPSAIILGFSIFLEFFTDLAILSQIFAGISIILSSYSVVSEAIEDITHKRITANILMVIAAVAAFFIFHGQEGATAILLYSIAEHLEEITTEKSKRAIRALLELAPDEALLKVDNDYKTVPTSEIKIDDIIGIKPGMKAPLDGIILNGSAYIDESAITGESVPVFKQKDDEVYAASIITDSFLDIRVDKEPSNTVVAQIAQSIQNALKNKSKNERFIERFARYYTPIILLAAILVMILPPLLLNLDFNTWFYRGLVLLVVSCPCALTLSTPLANITALTKLAKEGIMVKGNRFIEMIDDIDVFAFDKTGTLTEGNLRVFEILAKKTSENEILIIAASLEKLSEHPIAKAILDQAKELNLNLKTVGNFEVIKGKGIKGTIDGKEYYVGNQVFIEHLKYDLPLEELQIIEETGTIPIFVGDVGQLLGIITIRDVLRVTAPILMAGLKKRGLNSVLISGDKQRVCNTIGACLDIDESRGELLPDQKLVAIKELKKTHKGVAMVGDGINDAPALALSDLGIAIGASSTDLTLETADVIIMNDDLRNVLKYVDISKKTNRIIKQNIWTSIIVKVSFAVLTVIGLMTLWLAVGIGDMGVSLLVLANGMRVFRYKNKFSSVSSEKIESQAKVLVCEHCQTKNIIPQHHGRDMIIQDGKLICWRKMFDSEQLEPCEEEMPLDCPICENEYKIY